MHIINCRKAKLFIIETRYVERAKGHRTGYQEVEMPNNISQTIKCRLESFPISLCILQREISNSKPNQYYILYIWLTCKRFHRIALLEIECDINMSEE